MASNLLHLSLVTLSVPSICVPRIYARAEARAHTVDGRSATQLSRRTVRHTVKRTVGPHGGGLECRPDLQVGRNARMKLIIQPDTGVVPILTAIKQARKTIDVLIFRLDRRDIAQALCAAVTRGVVVR